MRLFAKSRPTLMTKKYYSMLLGGTLTMMVTSIMLMSDSIIAGAVIGPDAVASVTLVTPLYSLAGFFGSVISIGIPVLYSTEMGVVLQSKYFAPPGADNMSLAMPSVTPVPTKSGNAASADVSSSGSLRRWKACPMR